MRCTATHGYARRRAECTVVYNVFCPFAHKVCVCAMFRVEKMIHRLVVEVIIAVCLVRYSGGVVPSAPRNLEVSSVVDDPRPGFLGHAVITLEWDLPEQSKTY